MDVSKFSDWLGGIWGRDQGSGTKKQATATDRQQTPYVGIGEGVDGTQLTQGR